MFGTVKIIYPPIIRGNYGVGSRCQTTIDENTLDLK
jgi:hypothetical protein